MQVLLSGTDFPHEIGEMAPPKIVSYYGVYCFSTAFQYHREGRMVLGQPGQMLINPPGSVICHGPADPGESFTNDWLHISEDFGRLLEQYPLPLDRAFSLPPQTLIPTAIRQIHREQLLQQPGYREKVDCILTQLVIDLYRLTLQSPPKTMEARLEETRNSVLSGPEKPWTLEAMARLSGYSPSRFSALYTARYGISPKAELLESRFRMARQMLCYSDLPVSAVASACGFQSLYYFSKFFRQRTGLSPTAWAEEQRQQQAALK